MAKVTFGPVVSEARGMCGNQVFARDRGGAYVRAKAKVVNPNTSYQAMVRAWEKAIAQAWSNTLTDQQRQAWRALADLLARKNVVGDTAYLSGFHQFCQSNLNLFHAGGSQLNDAPARIAATDPGPITISASSNPQHLQLTPTNTPPPGYGMILKTTKPLPPGVNFFAHRLRQLWATPPAPLPPSALPDLTLPYLAKFQKITGGMKIGATLAYVNLATGAKSPTQSALATVKGPADMLQQISITLTPAQIKQAPTLVLPLIPAPGPGQTITVLNLRARLNFKTTPYTTTGAPRLSTAIGGIPGWTYLVADITALLQSTTTQCLQQTPNWSINTPNGDDTNQQVNLALWNGTAANGDSPLDVTIDYAIDPLP
jgi:hypothetical protein